jgi:hypothetical protein
MCKSWLSPVCTFESTHVHAEAEFLDVTGTTVLRVFLHAIHSYSPLPPLSKSGLKLVCNVNVVY